MGIICSYALARTEFQKVFISSDPLKWLEVEKWFFSIFHPDD